MLFRGICYSLVGILLIFAAFPELRGKRRRSPPSADDKAWRSLLFVSALLLIALGVRAMVVALRANGG